MLNYSQFEFFGSNRDAFKFQKLIIIDNQRSIYSCLQTNKRYYVSVFNSQIQCKALHTLWKKGIFKNIKGFLKKKNIYYCFAETQGFETLAQIIDRSADGSPISELFCVQLIEDILEMVLIGKELEVIFKIIDPHHIAVRESNQTYKFSFIYSFSHSLFQGLKIEDVNESLQFCAPQVIVSMKNQFELVRKQFEKACLYSLGLVLLYCFGYRIKNEQRIKAFKNPKQFNIFIKAIRKQIRLLQGGKFISKCLKVLLESNQFVRDTPAIFKNRINSFQFESLRKYVYKPILQIQDRYVTTLCSDHTEQLHKSRLNNTIEIEGSDHSSGSNQIPHLNTYHSYQKEDNSINRNSFKKSPQNLKQIQPYEQVNQKMVKTPRKQDIPSPVQIHLDWDESDDEDNYQNKLIQNQNNQLIVNDVQQQKNIKFPMIQNIKKSYSDIKSKLSLSPISKTAKSTDEKYRNIQKLKVNQIIEQIPSNSELRQNQKNSQNTQMKFNDESINKIDFIPKDQQSQQIFEEPQIIKYLQPNNQQPSSPKLTRKKTSSDLQDMTLIQEINNDQQLISRQQLQQSNKNELDDELTKKSQGILMTLIITCLIYKIVDYFIY